MIFECSLRASGPSDLNEVFGEKLCDLTLLILNHDAFLMAEAPDLILEGTYALSKRFRDSSLVQRVDPLGDFFAIGALEVQIVSLTRLEVHQKCLSESILWNQAVQHLFIGH